MPKTPTAKSASTKNRSSRAKSVPADARPRTTKWAPNQPIQKVYSRRFSDRGENYDITVALVVHESGDVSVGISKRNPKDAYNQREAVSVAVRRAQPWFNVQEMAQEHFDTWALKTIGSKESLRSLRRVYGQLED